MPKLKISGCTVELLDGSDIIVDNDKLHTCKELIDEVCQKVGIEETAFFGLKYKHPKDDKCSWLDHMKPLNRQLRNASQRFQLAVQFYPHSLQIVQDEITRYQFVLQVRKNLLTGDWSCTTPTQALLASYVAQSEFGDYDSEQHEENYLDELVFMADQDKGFLDKVKIFHKRHTEINASDADWLYMETARKISLFGMQVFNIMDADGNSMVLGVNISGIHIFHMNTCLHSFLWPIVSKIHFHAKEIILGLNIVGQDELMSVAFLCPTILDAKRIAKAAKLQKEFACHGGPKGVINTNKEENLCQHLSSTQPLADFSRVDSQRFSKRVLRTSDYKDDIKEEEQKDNTKQKVVRKKNRREKKKKTVKETNKESNPNESTKEFIIPDIVETPPIAQFENSYDESNTEQVKSSTPVSDTRSSNVHEVMEPVDDKVQDSKTEEVVALQHKDNQIKNVNTVDTDVEIVIIDVDEVKVEDNENKDKKDENKEENSDKGKEEDEFAEIENKEVNVVNEDDFDEIEFAEKEKEEEGTLMKEIEKELNESFEFIAEG